MKLALALAAVSAVALAAPPERPLGAEVQKKARAYTVETASVGGAAVLRANDHVDVLAVVTDPESKRQVAVTLLQNVVVLANASPAPGEPRQLSLLVIPEEAQLLAIAKAAGSLSATLRNPEDPNVLEQRSGATVTSALTGELERAKPTKR